ncbi:Winged helix DNA-binding domain-containing protein [Rhodococcus triatomae]|uniref:Winged helix DNA-binding domain-containing protein n=1 Tax=Rhodococcus triatomae TaxID=300028 RepID=A0A1G8LB53_9NOCA|nr:Winged helix DNA-binding domain-containing protein [Rhodococcus triatomae]
MHNESVTHFRSVDAGERRSRLARRHRLAPGSRARDVVDAADSLVALHATDQATIHLSAWARVDGLTVADVDHALHEERSLVKHLAMRRTLFVFPRHRLAHAQAGASDRVAAAERRRLAREVEDAGLHPDGERWIRDAEAAVLDALRGDRSASWTELRDELPILTGSIEYGEGKAWAGRAAIGPRILTVLSAQGRLVRAGNGGGWNVSRNRWAVTESWLGAPIVGCTAEDGTRELVRSWLRSFGPGTEADLKWWLGSTLTAVRRALAELDVVEVELDGHTGYLLADDVEPEPEIEPWGALLPTLDPTTMGWQEREWYLGPHREQLFDSVGNAGPTAWWEGRIVGGWWQDPDGAVVVHLLEDVGADARAVLDREAERLTEWIDGARVTLRYPSPLAKRFA